MPPLRRLWDSCVIIDYLAGREEVKEACSMIIEQAERGEIEIVVSAMATIEVAYLAGFDDQVAEERIRELFGRSYVVPVAIDMRVASLARDIVRRYRTVAKVKPPDAAHLATALQWQIPIVETTDPHLLRLNGLEGDPPIVIRKPQYEGTRPMPGF